MKLTPTKIFPTYRALTPSELKESGITALLLDVDNTLAPYEQPIPDEHIIAWLSDLRRAGISLAIVSNNGGDRINLFAKDLALPVFCKAKKPFPKTFRRAMAALGANPGETACLGDQIFTDILAGKWAKLKSTYLVPPIRDKKDCLTRLKRVLEKPVLKKYWRKHKNDG